MDELDPLQEAIYRATEYGNPAVTWQIPEDAVITPGPLPGPMLDGMVITSWR